MIVQNQERYHTIENLPDAKLVEMLDGDPNDYSAEAINYAKLVAEKRGGIERIKEELKEVTDQHLAKIPNLPKVWIGFVLTGAFIIGILVDLGMGCDKEICPVSFIVGIISSIFWFWCVHRFHKVLGALATSNGDAHYYPIAPATAVFYHFIPFYNLYWIVKWPFECCRFLNSKGVRVVSGGLLGFLFLASFVMIRIEGAFGLLFLYALGTYLATKIRTYSDLTLGKSSNIASKSGIGKKHVLLGCGIVIGAVLVLIGCIVGYFLIIADEPKDIDLLVTCPSSVVIDERFELTVKIMNNRGDDNFVLDEVDIGDDYIGAFIVESTTPPAKSSSHDALFDCMSFTFKEQIPAGDSLFIVFSLRSIKFGFFLGDVAIYDGNHSLTQIVQTVVEDKVDLQEENIEDGSDTLNISSSHLADILQGLCDKI